MDREPVQIVDYILVGSFITLLVVLLAGTITWGVASHVRLKKFVYGNNLKLIRDVEPSMIGLLSSQDTHRNYYNPSTTEHVNKSLQKHRDTVILDLVSFVYLLASEKSGIIIFFRPTLTAMDYPSGKIHNA